MILSMGGFAIEDLILKVLSDAIPVSHILVYVGVIGAVLLTFVHAASVVCICGTPCVCRADTAARNAESRAAYSR